MLNQLQHIGDVGVSLFLVVLIWSPIVIVPVCLIGFICGQVRRK